MTIRAYTCAERPDLWERTEHEVTDVWPEYNTHGDVLYDYWLRLDEAFAEYQFALYDEKADAVLAEGHSIPCAWDGTPEGVPDGIDGLIVDAFRLRDEGGAATTLSALAIEIAPAHQGGGLSRTMIGAIRALAADHGLPDLIAPLRPTWKERYPLTPIERYASWRREDGLLFDPWLRVHERLGAEVIGTAPEAMRIPGTVAEWEEWAGMAFPESGHYVVPRALVPVEIDRERDEGLYVEPCVWMRHAR